MATIASLEEQLQSLLGELYIQQQHQEKQNDMLRNENVGQSTIISSLKQQVQSLQDELHIQQEQNDDLRKQNDDLRKQNNDLRKQNDAHKATIVLLEKELQFFRDALMFVKSLFF